ncbi:MAG: hypothetical protein ACOC56_00915 [Atribacterota bacterium]
MPLDLERIKQALDSFEDDNYTEAKDILRSELSKVRDEYIKDKTGVDLNPDTDDEDTDDPDTDDPDTDDPDTDDPDTEDEDQKPDEE